jgi:hypothetical protein
MSALQSWEDHLSEGRCTGEAAMSQRNAGIFYLCSEMNRIISKSQLLGIWTIDPGPRRLQSGAFPSLMLETSQASFPICLIFLLRVEKGFWKFSSLWAGLTTRVTGIVSWKRVTLATGSIPCQQ